MYLDCHGGGCCGITHIVEFGPQPNEKSLRRFKELVNSFPDEQYEGVCRDGFEGEWVEDGWDEKWKSNGKKFSCILEACLTDRQMQGWAPHLKEVGFKVVTRFPNSNSGNVVNVLHYNPAGRRKIPAVPYKW
jgi:hypothetical protein